MKYGTTNAVLKPLDEVVLPDPRFEILVIGNEAQMRPFQLLDMHERLCLTKLNNEVPPEVQTHFQTALNLMLYAWFVFEFQTVAEKQSYASLEFALRRRFPNATKTIMKAGKEKIISQTLGPLLRLAVTERLIVAERLPAWERVKANHAFHAQDSVLPLVPPPSANDWLLNLIETIPDFRNDLAHGSTKLYFESSFWALELCADLINALFSTKGEKPGSVIKPTQV